MGETTTSFPPPLGRVREGVSTIIQLLKLITLKPFLPIVLIILALLLAGCGGTAATTGSTATSTVTAPPAAVSVAQPGAYSFAVCGDNRMNGIDSGVLKKITDSARSRGAAFIVDVGDVTTSGTLEELVRYREFAEASGLKFYTAPGNHDVGRGGTSAAYESVIGAPYYSFDYGGDHFVVADNADDTTGIDPAQMEWLKSDLAAANDRPHQFIFTHIPVSSADLPTGHVAGELGAAGLESGRLLVDEAGKYPNVSAFFFGHVHAYAAYRVDGINAYISGGAGAPLHFPESAGGYFHYLLVTVRGDSVEVEVVRV